MMVCISTVEIRAQASGTLVQATIADASTGVLLQGAEVKVRELGVSARSDILGDVRFPGVPSGDYIIEARLLGYQRLSTPLKISGRDSLSVMLFLRQTSQELPPVTVVDTAYDLLSEFEQRRRRHIGGYFITEDEVYAQLGSTLGNVILARIPGVGVVRHPDGSESFFSRRGPNTIGQGCGIRIYYDGVRTSAPTSLAAVGGIEFYNPGFVPVRYRELGSGCGVMLIWSRRKY
jgi:hypothetical protein